MPNESQQQLEDQLISYANFIQQNHYLKQLKLPFPSATLAKKLNLLRHQEAYLLRAGIVVQHILSAMLHYNLSLGVLYQNSYVSYENFFSPAQCQLSLISRSIFFCNMFTLLTLFSTATTCGYMFGHLLQSDNNPASITVIDIMLWGGTLMWLRPNFLLVNNAFHCLNWSMHSDKTHQSYAKWWSSIDNADDFITTPHYTHPLDGSLHPFLTTIFVSMFLLSVIRGFNQAYDHFVSSPYRKQIYIRSHLIIYHSRLDIPIKHLFKAHMPSPEVVIKQLKTEFALLFEKLSKELPVYPNSPLHARFPEHNYKKHIDKPVTCKDGVTYDKDNLFHYFEGLIRLVYKSKKLNHGIASPFLRSICIGRTLVNAMTPEAIKVELKIHKQKNNIKLTNWAKSKDPKELECSITLEPCNNPLLTPDGHSFSASHIIQWLSNHNSCPNSRLKLTQCQLILDLSLYKLTQALREKTEHTTSEPPQATTPLTNPKME